MSRPNPIARFAESGSTQVYFPGTHAQSRWDTETKGLSAWNTFRYVGRVGDTIDFASLHPDLQTTEVAKKIGAQSTFPDVGFEACGSRGEVQNDATVGNHHEWLDSATFQNGRDYSYDRNEQKSATWGTVVTHARDQLRQRVAWALAQILVTGKFGVLDQEHELWSTYYDIFVYNAFGNYRNILREVSASPLMAQYLSFLGNRAQAISKKFPDENYARELMQLFSIGLYELNMDGTQKTDPKTGLAIMTYVGAACARLYASCASVSLHGHAHHHHTHTTCICMHVRAYSGRCDAVGSLPRYNLTENKCSQQCLYS